VLTRCVATHRSERLAATRLTESPSAVGSYESLTQLEGLYEIAPKLG
jgi:hypothetical protein